MLWTMSWDEDALRTPLTTASFEILSLSPLLSRVSVRAELIEKTARPINELEQRCASVLRMERFSTRDFGVELVSTR